MIATTSSSTASSRSRPVTPASSQAGGHTPGPTCAHCSRTFDTPNSLWQHTRAKHGKAAARTVKPPSPEREPSLGSELAEAISDARAGLPVEGYLLDMFRDQFPRGTKRIARAAGPGRAAPSGAEGGGHG